MAIERKYGEIAVKKIGHEEPIIIFRAQDLLSQDVLHFYLDLCTKEDCNKEHIDMIKGTIKQFADWQEMNPTKIPDTD